MADGSEEVEAFSATESPFAQKFEQFFKSSCIKQVERLAAEYPEKRSLNIDFQELEKFDYELADELLSNPDPVLEGAKEAIGRVDVPALEIKEFAPHVRFFNLPKEKMPLIREIGAEHLGKLIAVEGIVKQFTEVKPKLENATWECRRCGNTYRVEQEGQAAAQPSVCTQCKVRDFKLIPEKSQFVNYQKIAIQEPLEKLKGGEQASNLDIYVSDDLVNKVSPGDKTVVVGVLRLHEPKYKGTVYERYLEAVHLEETEMEFEEVQVTPEEEEEIKKIAKSGEIYPILVQSIAPAIYGHEIVKEAIGLQLFSGVKKLLPDGTKIRGNIHVLLVGDPGCLVADERIVLGNGAIEKIGNIGKEHLQKINLQVLTGEGMKKRSTATVFHSYKSQPVMEIITESGKSIKGTLNHPLLCVSKEEGRVKRQWKRLDEFALGDKVAVTTSIPCTITAPVETGFRKLEYTSGPKFKGRLPQKLDVGLAGLLGYLTGDGWARKYEVGFVVSETEKDILTKLVENCRELFEIVPALKRKRGPGRKVWLTYAKISSNDIAQNLWFLRERRVPGIVFGSGNTVVSEFLKWLYEADGCVFCKGRGRRAISFKAKNIELLRDIQVLLLRFAIHSRIYGNALQIRRGRDILKFAEKIGFVSQKKKTVLKALASEAKKFARFNSQRSERIVKIIRHKNEDVFDIEVPEGHRFIANGIISHNTAKSQMLQAADRIAPKSIYTAGKTSSGPGLTATAVKDDFGEGAWTLKAGALVLANGGIAFVDEFDKMDPEDRDAMHEAMEQGMVSIAKAGIVTRFKTETSILAAANPKFSRFDPFMNFMEQIDLPPTLISRFDLFFMIKDVLDRKKDTEIASHILQIHQFGETVMQRSNKKLAMEKEVLEKAEKFAPKISEDFLRKYVSYARQNCFPVLSSEAIQQVSDFYVNLREKGKKEGNYSATHRQLEALVRLSEASARIRLSDVVEPEDAERAIRIFRHSMEEVVVDPTTGKVDIDIITSGQAHSKTNELKKILMIILGKAKEMDLVPLDDVYAEAASEGIDKSKVSEYIAELKKRGEIYEPTYGAVKPADKK